MALFGAVSFYLVVISQPTPLFFRLVFPNLTQLIGEKKVQFFLISLAGWSEALNLLIIIFPLLRIFFFSGCTSGWVPHSFFFLGSHFLFLGRRDLYIYFYFLIPSLRALVCILFPVDIRIRETNAGLSRFPLIRFFLFFIYFTRCHTHLTKKDG